jgi:hypothetical protein
MPDEREVQTVGRGVGMTFQSRRKLRHEFRLVFAMFLFGWVVSLLKPVAIRPKTIDAMIDFAAALQDE